MNRERLGAIALMLVSILVGALAIEGAIRLFGPGKLGLKVYSDLRGNPYPAAYSDYLPFTTPPDTTVRVKTQEFDVAYIFNHLGYLGRFPERVEKQGRQRVLLLGDSNMLGWGVNFPETFAGLLQDRLGSTVEVINAAYRNGASPDAYYAYLVKEGMALQPDVIVMLLSLNDVSPDMHNNVWLETDHTGAPTRLRTGLPYTGPDGYIFNNLPWYHRIPVLRESYFLTDLGSRLSALAGSQVQPLQVNTREELVDRFKISMRAIHDITARNKVRVVVGAVPAPFQVRLFRYRLDHELFNETSRSLGFDHFDLKQHFQIDDYFVADGHFSPKGHKTVTELFLPKIVAGLKGRTSR